MSGPTTPGMARLAVLLAVLAALVAGCGGGDAGTPSAGPGEPVDVRQLARAASTSAEASSGRFSFALEASMPGAEETFSFSGEGAFDVASERASFSVDMSSFAALLGGLLTGLGAAAGADAPDFDEPDGWRIDAIRDGSTRYVRFPALAGKLPEGKAWIRSEDGAAASDLEGLGQLTEVDPRELLEILREVSGDVETVGTETVRGAETTHYRATLDATSATASVPEADREDFRALADKLLSQSGLSEIPLDVWIDDDGLLRKFQLDVSATQPGASEPSRAALTFEIWDVGRPVAIEVPPASGVVDASELED